MNIGEDQALSSLSERQSPSPCPLTSPHKFTFMHFPESSNFWFEFFLTHESIKQFPGPKSLLCKSVEQIDLLIIVIF